MEMTRAKIGNPGLTSLVPCEAKISQTASLVRQRTSVARLATLIPVAYPGFGATALILIPMETAGPCLATLARTQWMEEYWEAMPPPPTPASRHLRVSILRLYQCKLYGLRHRWGWCHQAWAYLCTGAGVQHRLVDALVFLHGWLGHDGCEPFPQHRWIESWSSQRGIRCSLAKGGEWRGNLYLGG